MNIFEDFNDLRHDNYFFNNFFDDVRYFNEFFFSGGDYDWNLFKSINNLQNFFDIIDISDNFFEFFSIDKFFNSSFNFNNLSGLFFIRYNFFLVPHNLSDLFDDGGHFDEFFCNFMYILVNFDDLRHYLLYLD